MPCASINLTATPDPVRHQIGRAWGASGVCLRLTMGAAMAIACFSSASSRVPVGAGLAAAMLVPAALVDVHERRLPNQIIVVGSIVFVGGCVVESVVGVSLPVESIVVGVVAMALPLFTMHLASPASMGFGDVKLGVALGAVAGSVDWRLALWALVLASGASAAIAISRRRRTLAFGPGLIGATIALLALTAVAPDDTALEDADRTLYVVDS